MAFNLETQTQKIIDKLVSIPVDNPNLYCEDEVSSCITMSQFMGCVVKGTDVDVYGTLYKKDDKEYFRFVYQIKTSNGGKIKNIDFVMGLIRDFEHAFVFADKINVIQESGVTYLDVFKLK